jgi:soluble lytic murein transglycosylase
VSARTASSPARRASQRSAARRQAALRRRRLLAVLVVALLSAGGVVVLAPLFHHVASEIDLPLRHEDIIRQQARDKDLDPALIAAVIYAESHFIDGRTSSAGAEGLMQLTPATAHYIAQKSGGTAFQVSDLATAQVNIAYGSFYLRYLLNRYEQNRVLALAAYNAGEGNVDSWLARSTTGERKLAVADIPFPETKAYVGKVLGARRAYRARYAAELGL